MAKRGLPPKRRKFVNEYLKDCNGTQAAIRAGYSPKTANEQASDLLAIPSIRAAVDKRLYEQEITTDRILSELAKMAFANMMDFVKVQTDGSIYFDFASLTREQAATMQEVTVDEYTEGRGDARNVKRTRFKLADKRGSLELLGKYLKLWTDRTESSGPNGGPIPIEVKPKSLIELAAKILEERNKDANASPCNPT